MALNPSHVVFTRTLFHELTVRRSVSRDERSLLLHYFTSSVTCHNCHMAGRASALRHFGDNPLPSPGKLFFAEKIQMSKRHLQILPENKSLEDKILWRALIYMRALASCERIVNNIGKMGLSTGAIKRFQIWGFICAIFCTLVPFLFMCPND